MIDDLTRWANWSQIGSLIVSAITLLLMVIIWIWRSPVELLRRLRRPWLLYVLSAVFFFSLGLYASSLKATPSVDKGILIESMPVKVDNYEGINYPKVGKGSSHLSVMFDSEGHISYLIDYSLPNDGDGWTGLAFTFSNAQDLAESKFIEVTIDFGDEQTNTRLFIKDEGGQKDSVLLGMGIPLGTGISSSTSGKEVTFRIPLDANFTYVNRKIVKEIDFDCDASTTRGNRTFTVKRIRFLKP